MTFANNLLNLLTYRIIDQIFVRMMVSSEGEARTLHRQTMPGQNVDSLCLKFRLANWLKFR